MAEPVFGEPVAEDDLVGPQPPHPAVLHARKHADGEVVPARDVHHAVEGQPRTADGSAVAGRSAAMHGSGPGKESDAVPRVPGVDPGDEPVHVPPAVPAPRGWAVHVPGVVPVPGVHVCGAAVPCLPGMPGALPGPPVVHTPPWDVSRVVHLSPVGAVVQASRVVPGRRVVRRHPQRRAPRRGRPGGDRRCGRGEQAAPREHGHGDGRPSPTKTHLRLPPGPSRADPAPHPGLRATGRRAPRPGARRERSTQGAAGAPVTGVIRCPFGDSPLPGPASRGRRRC